MDSPEPWESRPDTQAKKGVGVLIDTDYLASDKKEYSENPYYLVIDGKRYYGATPEKAVESARGKVMGTLPGGVPSVASEQVSTAIPSGRTMGARARNTASAAARGAKGAASRAAQGTRNAASAAARGVKGALTAAGKLFQKKPAANTESLLPKPSGPTFKNRAMGSLKSAGTGIQSVGSKMTTGMKSLTAKAGQAFRRTTNPSVLPGEGMKDPLLPKGGGRPRRTRKSPRLTRRVSARA